VAGGGAGRGRKLLAERWTSRLWGVWAVVGRVAMRVSYATNDLLTKGGLLRRDSSVTAGIICMHARCTHNTPPPWPRATRTRASKRGVLGVQVRDSHERPAA
jgi:hypothetical protein